MVGEETSTRMTEGEFGDDDEIAFSLSLEEEKPDIQKPFVDCDAKSSKKYVGFSVLSNTRKAVEEICENVKLSFGNDAEDFSPNVCITFATRKYLTASKKGKPVTPQIILEHFPKWTSLVHFGVNHIGVMASDLKNSMLETCAFVKDSTYKEGMVICFLQVPGLSARSFVQTPKQDSIFSFQPRMPALERKRSDLLFCSENTHQSSEGQETRRNGIVNVALLSECGDFDGSFDGAHRIGSLTGVSVNKGVRQINTVYGWNGEVASDRGLFGIELFGSPNLRFSLMIGSQSDCKGDGLGFTRKCAEFKKQIDEKNALEKGENVMLLSMICAGRSRAAKFLPQSGVDFDVVTTQFPDVPVAGCYTLGEILPKGCSMEGKYAYYSVWTMISYIPDDALRTSDKEDIFITQEFGLDAEAI